MQTDSRYPWGKGTVKIKAFITPNDNTETWTTTQNKIWKILYFELDYACSATAGNRDVRIEFIGNGGQTLMLTPNVRLTANQKGVIRLYPGAIYSTTVAEIINFDGVVPDAALQMCIPEWLFLYADNIKFWDSANISATDDMTCRMKYIEYDA